MSREYWLDPPVDLSETEEREGVLYVREGPDDPWVEVDDTWELARPCPIPLDGPGSDAPYSEKW